MTAPVPATRPVYGIGRGPLVEEGIGAATPATIVVYALILIVGAVVAFAILASRAPVLPWIAIDGGASGTALAVVFGVTFWVLFGFMGSVKPRGIGGGAVITFHMPFVIGGTILGGPLVGALMGLVSLTELRELRRAPWYGILANHAVCVLAAAAAGLAGEMVGNLIAPVLPGAEPIRVLATGFAVAVVFVVTNVLLVVPVIVLRTGAEFGTIARRAVATLRATMVAELTLGWLMAATYLFVAWWTPFICVLAILAVWDAHDRREALHRDPLTGLLNDAGVQPLLDAAMVEARQRGRRHAILFIDLDRFGKINKEHGADIGDDVIRAVALRLLAAVRSSDTVGRQNRAGDEFLILLRDIRDQEMALHLASRIHASIIRPLRVRGESLVVSVGASIGVAVVQPPIVPRLDELKREADERMQRVKRSGGGVLGPDGIR
ncbi:MAG: GGDEF domain-containing protein [Chloroflexi bacterium]|nr:GGDEF domain-containing protein [Chloroflexota bacterium]